MNNRNKRAGQSTRGMAEKRYKSKAGFVLFMAVLAFAILILLIKPNILGIGGLGFLALFFLFLVITGYMDIGTKNMERGSGELFEEPKPKSRSVQILTISVKTI